MAANRFQRYVDGLSDEEALALQRIVCRRAAAIYGPMYRDKQKANYEASRDVYYRGKRASGRMVA